MEYINPNKILAVDFLLQNHAHEMATMRTECRYAIMISRYSDSSLCSPAMEDAGSEKATKDSVAGSKVYKNLEKKYADFP